MPAVKLHSEKPFTAPLLTRGFFICLYMPEIKQPPDTHRTRPHMP